MLIYLFAIIAISNARRLPHIYWNSSNPIFDISNTDHVISVRLFDRVNILCPAPSQYPTVPYEYTKLYAVSLEGYDICELQHEKPVGVCQDPTRQSTISITFRDFSPLPNAVEFQPGRSYYVISTSDGTKEGIDNRRDGLCKTKHMKLKFEVHSVKSSGTEDYTEEQISNVPRSLRPPEMSTPLLYIIHTSDSNSDSYFAQDEDDDGASSITMPNVMFLILSFTLCIVLS